MVTKSSPPTLTHCEARVYELATRGVRNKEIASALGITPRTVKFHLSGIFRKFRVENRIELIVSDRARATVEAPKK